MIQVAVLSDSHGHLGSTQWLRGCQEIWHAGDWGNGALWEELPAGATLRGVYGNIDGADVRSRFPEELLFEVEQVRVFMTHIGGYPSHYPYDVREKLAQYRPHLFVCGHSHILKIVRDPQHKGMLYINPGAVGRVGLHQVRTGVLLTLVQGTVQNVRVVELGTRAQR